MTLNQRLLKALQQIADGIDRQLALIAERAKGNYLDKQPVINALALHASNARAAIQEAEQLAEQAVAAQLVARMKRREFDRLKAMPPDCQNTYTLHSSPEPDDVPLFTRSQTEEQPATLRQQIEELANEFDRRRLEGSVLIRNLLKDKKL